MEIIKVIHNMSNLQENIQDKFIYQEKSLEIMLNLDKNMNFIIYTRKYKKN